MPAGNVSVYAEFEAKLRVKYDTYLVGAEGAPITFATEDEQKIFSKGGSTGSAEYVAATETEPSYVNLTTGGNSFYFYNGTLFDAATGIVGLNFDYMPKSAGMVLNIDDGSGNWNAWTNYTNIAELRETELVYQGEKIASLTKDAWNTVDIKFDLQLGTITFTVGDNDAVTKPLIGTGGGKFQSNATVTPTSFRRLQVNPYNKSTGTGYLTNLTIGTINRADALPNKTLTVTASTGGSAYIGEEGTTTFAVAQSTNVTATAVVSDGYRFANWTTEDGSTVLGTETTIQRRLYADETIKANFDKLYTVTVNQPVEGGTISADKTSAIAGEKITLSNTPASGYDFTSYDITGASLDAESENIFTMPEDNVTVTATFTKKAGELAGLKLVYTLDASAETPVSITGIDDDTLFTVAQGTHVENDEITVESKYKAAKKVETGDGTGLYKVYTYKSGLDDAIKLKAGENTAYVEMTALEGEYLIYEDFESDAATAILSGTQRNGKHLIGKQEDIEDESWGYETSSGTKYYTVKNKSDSKVEILQNAHNAGNGYAAAKWTLPDLPKAIVTVDFDYYVQMGRPALTLGTADRAPSGKAPVTANAMFNFGLNLQSNSPYAMGKTSAFTASKYNEQWVHYHVVIDQKNQKVSYTVTNATETVKTETDVAYVDTTIAAGTKVAILDFHDYISDGVSFFDNFAVQNTGDLLE